jgi:hypothetical protein
MAPPNLCPVLDNLTLGRQQAFLKAVDVLETHLHRHDTEAQPAARAASVCWKTKAAWSPTGIIGQQGPEAESRRQVLAARHFPAVEISGIWGTTGF